MNIFETTILGQVRPKKNSKRVFKNKKTGKSIFAPSELHEAWHRNAIIQLLQKGFFGFTRNKTMLGCGPFHVEIDIVCEDMRVRDCSNMVESIMDLLVDVNIIDDDNRAVCPSVHGLAYKTDKKEPRATIKISKFTPPEQ